MIIGVDEVGRGCLAGPVVAGAVFLGDTITGLRDSKKLTKLQRTLMDQRVRSTASAFGIGWVAVEELDTVGMTAAVRLAMQRAIQALGQIHIDLAKEIVIDGHFNFLHDQAKTRCLIKADDLIPAVSAASIIAKVARDAYMIDMAKQYPDYHFESHVGYGTKAHFQALQTLGVTPLHRRSFAPIRAMV